MHANVAPKAFVNSTCAKCPWQGDDKGEGFLRNSKRNKKRCAAEMHETQVMFFHGMMLSVALLINMRLYVENMGRHTFARKVRVAT